MYHTTKPSADNFTSSAESLKTVPDSRDLENLSTWTPLTQDQLNKMIIAADTHDVKFYNSLMDLYNAAKKRAEKDGVIDPVYYAGFFTEADSLGQLKEHFYLSTTLKKVLTTMKQASEGEDIVVKAETILSEVGKLKHSISSQVFNASLMTAFGDVHSSVIDAILRNVFRVQRSCFLSIGYRINTALLENGEYFTTRDQDEKNLIESEKDVDQQKVTETMNWEYAHTT